MNFGFSTTKFKKVDKNYIDSSKRRLLTVELVEGRGLKALNKSRGTFSSPSSDPFGTIGFVDLGGRDIKTETFKIKQKNATIAPKWNETFIFGQQYDLRDEEYIPTLVLCLYHQGQFDFSETCLGKIHVDLTTIDTNLKDTWYQLEPDARATDVTGEIRLKLKFNINAGVEDEEAPMIIKSGVELAIASDAQLAASVEDMPPNTLLIKLLSARNLKGVNLTLTKPRSSDPFVTFTIKDLKSAKSSVIPDNLNPVWQEDMRIEEVMDASGTLEVHVQDYSNVGLHKTLGKVAIPVTSFRDKQPVLKTYKLLNKDFDGGKDRGEIDISIQWIFDVQVNERLLSSKTREKSSVIGQVTRFAKKLTGGDGSDSDTDVVMVNDAKEAEERPLTEEEKKKKAEADAAKLKELQDIDIKTGDYQVLVHIIEARDLKPENFDGTSDPVVYISCFGQKLNTKVINNVTNCVFDEVHIFNFRDLDKSTFNEGYIRIACYDATIIPGMNEKMIGAYAMDAAQIYSLNKDHEFYRQWVPLMDDEDGGDVGVQGYMKISIQIVGPGEKIKFHDEATEIQAELAAEAKAGNDVSSLITNVPTIQREWQFLVVSIYRLEGIPVMDGKAKIAGIGFSAGTDAFLELTFGGGKPYRTKVKVQKGDSRFSMNPEFNCDLWYPISIPTMTQNVKLSAFDYDTKGNELIGIISEKYRAIDGRGRPCHLLWHNFYGAPEFKQGATTTDNLKKLGKALVTSVEEGLLGAVNYGELYNNVPDRASSWKGRALLQFRIERPENRPLKLRTPEIVPFRRKIKPLATNTEPPTRAYILQAAIFSGVNLPDFNTLLGKQGLHVTISIGLHEINTGKAKYEKGMCRWNDFLRTDPVLLPKDVSQLPDIFIYLRREDNKPVCFYRIKAADIKTETCYGFDQPASWVLLQEDKSINALPDGEFPGQILVRLGFGYEAEANASLPEWKQSLENSKILSSYQVRIHIYQGADIPAADSNGLTDPYIKCCVLDQQKKTKVVKKSVYPAFYETIVFDAVDVPEYDNFRYAPQITFRVYDEDDTTGVGVGKMKEYLGTCSYPLCDAHITDDIPYSHEFPDPKWCDLFMEVPGDGQGKVLVLVQLIPIRGRKLSSETFSIRPETESAYIELIALGIRNLAPFQFQAMQAPFLELELNSFGTSFKSSTSSSKKPDPNNPNFLEKLTMEVELPKKSIFATPLLIRCRDTRLGGYFKPVVGVGIADLSTKLPWNKATYIAPQTDFFLPPSDPAALSSSSGSNDEKGNGILPGANDDDVALKASETLAKQIQTMKADKNIAMPTQPNLDEYVKKRVVEEDTGAGIFGALHHIKFEDAKQKKKLKSANTDYKFSAVDYNEDDTEEVPAWRVGRRELPSELEEEYLTAPFESYPLTRGKTTGLFGNTVKVVGVFKGIIRVKRSRDEPDIFSKELMDVFTKPKPYKIRLYCLAAKSLAAMDTNIFGKKTGSDPYLRIKLGSNTFDDRENYVAQVIEVDFYKLIEFDAELPGSSQLIIEVMDKDTIGSDDLIGRTVIDLEDRWFDNRWQKEGVENRRLPGDNPANPNACRWDTKPLERRSLYQPSSKLPQGILECYLDIMKPEQAIAFPPDDVALPPKQIFQIRVVIWKSKNVPPMDSLEKMSDLYLKVWPEGAKPQETDTHWRCKRGKASWNYRLLFDVEVGHSTRIMKFPNLHFQLWDRDLLKWNDCAGEVVLNIGKYLRKAYRKNVPIKLFETPQGAAKKRQEKREQAMKRRDPATLDTGNDVPPPEPVPDITSSSGAAAAAGGDTVMNPVSSKGSAINNLQDDTNTSASASMKSSSMKSSPMSDNTSSKPKFQAADSDDEEGDSDDDDMGIGAMPNTPATIAKRRSTITLAASAAAANKNIVADDKNHDDEDKDKKKSAGWFGWLGWSSSDEDEEDVDTNEVKDEDEDDDNELKELLATFKSMTGLWEDDPADSAWIDLTSHDHNKPDQVTPMGSICYSIQIWPKDKATVMPVGAGRNEPNNNPFLPPPVGRLKFSWNPFVLGSALCGPALCAQLFCCLICIAFVLLMVFAQPFLTLMINILFFFG